MPMVNQHERNHSDIGVVFERAIDKSSLEALLAITAVMEQICRQYGIVNKNMEASKLMAGILMGMHDRLFGAALSDLYVLPKMMASWIIQIQTLEYVSS